MKERQRRIRALHELPPALEPPRELWPQIEAQLRVDAPVRRARRSAWQSRLLWRWAAAAAIVLLGAALAAGHAWLGTAVVARVDRGPLGTTPVIDAGDAARREALLRALDARLRGLPAPTQQQVRADLQLIERSMQDIQSALGREPGNVLLHEMLRDTEQDEQHLAVTVRDAGAWTEEASGAQGRVGS